MLCKTLNIILNTFLHMSTYKIQKGGKICASDWIFFAQIHHTEYAIYPLDV